MDDNRNPSSPNLFYWNRNDFSETLRPHTRYLSSSATLGEEKEPAGRKDKDELTNGSSSSSLRTRCGGRSSPVRSVWSTWRKYASSTSLHGLSSTADEQRPPLNRLCWSLFFLFMLGLTVFSLVLLLLRYREYPYVSVWDIQRSGYLDLPTVSICPMNVFNYNKINGTDADRNFLTKFEGWDSPNISSELLNMTISEVYRTYGFSVKDIIVRTALHYGADSFPIDSRYLSFFIQDKSSCVTMNDFRFGYKGYFSQHSTLEFYVDLRRQDVHPNTTFRGLYLYIHKSGISTHGVKPLLMGPGLTYYVQFSQTDYHFLPLPYKSFGEEGCVENNDNNFVNPLKIHPVYTRTNCLVELVEEISANLCGCVHEDYLEVFNVRECTTYQVLTCVQPIRTEVNNNQTQTWENEVKRKCPNACSDYVLDMVSSHMPFEENLRPDSPHQDSDYLHIVIQPKTTNLEIIKHEPEMTLLTITASVGGFMGLFVGASLITVAEFLEMCILVLVRGFLWKRSR